MTSYRKTADFDYQNPPFSADLPDLGPPGEQWLQVAEEHDLSGAYMATLKSLPIANRPMCSKCDVFERSIQRRAGRYLRVSGVPMAYAGFVTRGSDGYGKCEAHMVFPDWFTVDWRIFKEVFRASFDVCVTGQYQEHEVRPRVHRLKNRTPHGNVRHYVAKHAEHPDAHVLWELGDLEDYPLGDGSAGKPVLRRSFVPEPVNQDDADWLAQNDVPLPYKPLFAFRKKHSV